MPSGSREASHAGSWYTDDGQLLAQQLDGWLNAVPEHITGIASQSKDEGDIKTGPVEGARVIIAPHAGYSYSGPAAAWAYKSLDLSKAKRVFILGPSHHHYLTNCALSPFTTYSTPLGPLTLDTPTIAALAATQAFATMSPATDEAEHSIEMHLPYTRHMLARAAPSPAAPLPPIVPILVGNTSPAAERRYAALLAPYLADPANAFVVSSDFAHWGSRFRYTHEAWLDALDETGNTVCGRHPIGVLMAAMELLAAEGRGGRFKFVRYERSSDVEGLRDSSVSYCSAYAVL
ncbi:hypothetical protein FH972_021103 [Carpinus fangiana]|uniref:AmmeMemoRadiSam system protein B n=1 Tax=Carpinus fangiana TaxID=176857 RepID=A0A5N6KNJ4_9ROSI|nr:hypothetical protein FH972_021103 [Carpinus fangiana]